MLENIIFILQIIVSIILITSVLLQAPEGGLSPAFGGGGEMYRSRRNVEKFLLYVTVAATIVLVLLSVSLLFIQGK